ncbi:MAG: hypothetical protein CMF98_06940 [Candidatus Marinimicrobia bacterium]|nr:hypothetical protein [Candidatus Neomarinimicrobiota bacterium]OUW49846.1 MAG: hypothetical protein CBD50_04740 [bacterium TMED190]
MKNIYIKNLSISFFLFLIMGCENLLQNNDEVAIDSEELEFFSRSIEEDISLSKNSKNKLRRGINEFGEKNKLDKDRKPGFLWYLASEMQSTLNDEEKAEIFANIENKNHKINKPRQKHNEFERDEKNNNGHNQGEKDLFEIITDVQMIEYNLIVENFTIRMNSIKNRVESGEISREDVELEIEENYSLMNQAIDNLLTEDQKIQLIEMKAQREKEKEEFYLAMEEAKNKALGLSDNQIESLGSFQKDFEDSMLNLRLQIEAGELNKETAGESIKSLRENHRLNIESLLNDVQIEIMKIHNFLSYHWKICAEKDDLIKEKIDDEEYEFEESFEVED